MVISRQSGATTPSFAAILLLLAATAWFALDDAQTDSMSLKAELVNDLRGEAIQRINALQACYSDTRSWCDEDELLGYGVTLSGINNSAIISQVVNGDDIILTIETPSVEMAEGFSKHVIDPVVSGSQVAFTVEPPTKTHLFQDQVQRWEDNEFGRNSLENSIVMNSNNIRNIKRAEAQLARFQSLEVDSHTIDQLIVANQLDIGLNRLSFSGQVIDVNAGSVKINGDASADGDIELNNNDITNINELSGSSSELKQLNSAKGVINKASGDKISYEQAKINKIKSLRYTSESFRTQNLESSILDTNEINSNIKADIGTTSSLDFVSGEGGNWTYSNGSSREFISDNSNIGDSVGLNLSLTGDLRGNSLNTGTARYTSLAVLGRFTGTNFSSNDNFEASRSSVNDNFLSSQLNANDISRNRTEISDVRERVNRARSNSADNARLVKKNGADISSNEASIGLNNRTIDSNETDIDDVAASLSNSASDIGVWQDRLDKCMYQTQYCIPEDPSVTLSCTDCSQNEEQKDFSATASATITQCRQGCTYSWVINGDLSSSCASGSIKKGGIATLTCKVSKNGLSAQKRLTGSITINVKNGHYVTRTDSSSVNVNFFNKTAPTPIVNSSCSGCSASRNSGNFNAVILAAISNCPQGCSYSWNISGGAIGTCPSGSIAPGKTLTPSCNISGLVEDASTLSGSVSINVNNSSSSQFNSNDSENYNWENRTPANVIQGEISLTCDDPNGDCRLAERLSSYKGSASGAISISVNISSRVLNPIVTANIISSNCVGEKKGDLANYGRIPQINILNNNRTVSLRTFAFVQSSGESARSECEADVEFTVTSNSMSGVGVLREFIYIEACAVYSGGALCGPGFE